MYRNSTIYANKRFYFQRLIIQLFYYRLCPAVYRRKSFSHRGFLAIYKRRTQRARRADATARPAAYMLWGAETPISSSVSASSKAAHSTVSRFINPVQAVSILCILYLLRSFCGGLSAFRKTGILYNSLRLFSTHYKTVLDTWLLKYYYSLCCV